jgi:hypothetical protein
MTIQQDQFGVFGREYTAWYGHTQALPFRRDRNLTKGAFELDLDHMIDYVQPIFAAAAKRSTQFDYTKVAGEYLHDLDQIQVELENAPLGDFDRQAYSSYLAECRHLLNSLSSLPVAPEGHLGFTGSALQAFSFLVDEYGFKVGETSPIRVHFTTGEMFLSVEHSPECPMNSILVARRTGDRTPASGFILDDFAYVGGLGVLFDYEVFDLLNPVGILKFLQAAATLIRRYGGSLLSGDPEAFKEFQSKAEERERLYVENMEREHSAQH